MTGNHRFQRLRERYIRFVEKQGFAIITVVCVATITATALWSNHHEDSYVAPTPPVSRDVSAAQLLQQRLQDTAAPSPAPTEAPRTWLPPLAQTEVLRAYSPDHMAYSGVTGLWSIHNGVDLAATPGSTVSAIADGIVKDAGENPLLGAWLCIDHGDSVEALYAGMALSAAYIAGDQVRAGAVVGYTGNGPVDESDLAPHLHLQVTQDGVPIDPCTLWR